MQRVAERRPFGREALFKQVGAVAGATMLWLLSLTSATSPGQRPAVVAEAASLVVLAVVLTVAVPWRRLPEWLKAAPPLLVLLVGVRLQLLLNTGVWSDSAYLLLPVFWLAAFGTWREAGTGILLATAALFLQELVRARGAERWGDPATLVALSAAVALVIHPLFAKVRSRAERYPALQATDGLTGLPARRGWEGRVPQLLQDAAAAHQPVCVVAIHIDRLKAYADRYGRRDADRLVREAAAMWRDRLRKSDLVARVDSSNFAALLVGCSVEAAAGIAQRLTTILESPVTFSLGVAEWNGQESAAALSRRADAALDRASRAGGDRIEFGTLPSTDLEFLDWQGTVTLTEPSASDTLP